MFEKLSERKEKIDLNQFRVRHTDEVPMPDVVLSVDGKMIATRKNLFAISGKAKVGKSFLMAIINACVLKKGELGTLSSYLPKGKDKIIYVDTEQSKFHVCLAMKRIYKMVESNRIENLLMYNFRMLKTEQRLQATLELIANTKEVGLVIIDGLADLVKSVNDEILAIDLIETIQEYADTYDVAIGFVLHQNPSESTKMKGHLGTFATQKAETVLQIVAHKDDDSIKIVEALQTRNAKPNNFSFQISEDGMPEILDEIPSESSTKRVTKKYTDNERKAIIKEIFKNNGNEIKWTILENHVQEACPEMSLSSVKRFLTYAKEANFIYKDTPNSGWFEK